MYRSYGRAAETLPALDLPRRTGYPPSSDIRHRPGGHEVRRGTQRLPRLRLEPNEWRRPHSAVLAEYDLTRYRLVGFGPTVRVRRIHPFGCTGYLLELSSL